MTQALVPVLKSSLNSMPLAFAIGPQEIFVILLLLVILFGVKRLPQMGRSLGEGIRELRKAGRAITEEIDETKDTMDEVGRRVTEATGGKPGRR